MRIVLYRRRLSLTSGAGQLIRMHARGLCEAGYAVQLAAHRGNFRFSLNSGFRVRRYPRDELKQMAASPDHLVIDHAAEIAEADLVFVHNLMSEGVRHIKRRDWLDHAARESEFFKALNVAAPIVANSRLVQRALIEHFDLDPQRIVIHYPGFDSRRFRAESVRPDGSEASAQAGTGASIEANTGPSTGAIAEAGTEASTDTRSLRRRSRAALGLAGDQPLIGFVTSGDLDKRGLDILLQTASRISEARDDVRFLVVGAKRLPGWAASQHLVSTGRFLYRPKDARPERWFAALDLFLFPARFEEFGMVVSEAQACGIPVLTSRRVGAAECLPPEYESWIVDAPAADAFAAKALALLDDRATMASLAVAGIKSVASFDDDSYIRQTLETTRRCVLEKASRFAKPAAAPMRTR
ncbi:MAG TPA: glycosyltransferase family 4 protein [Woeseiaceae bacterium]|nr:glycosyltransferase family 4 protein [Woeseiaceae bacterium]